MQADSPHLLMVCTANICRSPIAEGLARAYAARRQRALEVRSASAAGFDGDPAHRNSIAVMQEVGLDIRPHRSQPVTEDLMAWADHVLVMELRHAADLRERFPEHADKVHLLGPFGGLMEVADPIGFWKEPFRTCREQLRRCVENFIDQLPARPT